MIQPLLRTSIWHVKIDKCELPTFYWLPKLHKRPYKSHFISNSSHCSTTILSKHITSALTAVKDHVIKYSETAFSNSNVNYFWSIKNSSEVIEKLRLRNFRGSHVSSFDFSTLYTSLPHALIKAKVLSLVNWCFNRESKTYLCTSDKAGFLATRNMTRINIGLARGYMKLLLSSWKNICAIWWHGLSTNSGDSYGHQLCSTYSRFIFILLREGLYVWPSKVETFWPHRYVQRYLSISRRYFHHR